MLLFNDCRLAWVKMCYRGALENFTDMCPVERLVHEWTVKCGGLFDQFLTKNEVSWGFIVVMTLDMIYLRLWTIQIFLQSVAEEKINVIVTDAIESFEEDKVARAVSDVAVIAKTRHRSSFRMARPWKLIL